MYISQWLMCLCYFFPSTLLGMMSPTHWLLLFLKLLLSSTPLYPSLDTSMSSRSIYPLSSVASSSSQSLGLATYKIILDIFPHLICLQPYWMYFLVISTIWTIYFHLSFPCLNWGFVHLMWKCLAWKFACLLYLSLSLSLTHTSTLSSRKVTC